MDWTKHFQGLVGMCIAKQALNHTVWYKVVLDVVWLDVLGKGGGEAGTAELYVFKGVRALLVSVCPYSVTHWNQKRSSAAKEIPGVIRKLEAK